VTVARELDRGRLSRHAAADDTYAHVPPLPRIRLCEYARTSAKR
jgi:hypothetical protein